MSSWLSQHIQKTQDTAAKPQMTPTVTLLNTYSRDRGFAHGMIG